MTDYLSRHLVALHTDYKVRSLSSRGGHSDHDAIFDEYLRATMVVLDAVYGRECTEHVRSTAPATPVRRRGPGPLARLVRTAHRYMQEWHAHLLAMS
jgi:hypothetical protein